MAVKAKRTVQALFDAMMDDEGVMPSDDANHARAEERDKGLDGRARVVADYIAGMTDRYAIAEYQRLYHMVELT